MEEKPINSGQKRFSIITLILIAFLIIVLVLNFASAGNSKKEISQSEFFTQVEEGKVAGVYFLGTTVYGINTDETTAKTEEKVKNFPKKYDFYFSCAYSFQLEKVQQAVEDYNTENPTKQIYFDTGIQQESFFSRILPYLYILLFAVLIYFTYKAFTKMNGKGMDFGKNKARMEAGLKVRFADVAGCDEEKQEVQEIVEFLKNPRKFTEMGARIPKGVLLVGPPGTGKTLLAKAIAGEAGVPFFSITGSDFVEMYVGVGAARVRDLFETAKRNMPCLVFIDEIDAVGRQRGAGLGNTNDEREQTLNQLLVQMDGFESNDGIVVIAATNRPDVLDPALLRAGRFDRRIVVNRPDLQGRVKILKLYAKNKPFADDIDWEGLARRLPGSTGADIENILNESAILAARDGRNIITQTDIFESSLKTQYGLSKKNHKTDEEDRKTTAYHEAGHAILMRVLKSVKVEVQEVTIIPRGIGGGMSGGMTSRIPEKEYPYYTREQLMEEIIADMGGRAAEKLKFGYFSTGASNDIQVATDVARDMVTKYGMSEKLGSVCYADEGEVFLGRDFQQRSNISDATARIIDEEIKAILDEGLERAINLLKENENILDEMAKVLLAKETIYSQEVNELISGKTSDEVIKNMEEREAERKRKDKEAQEKKEAEKQSKLDAESEASENLEDKVMDAFSGLKNQEAPENKTQKVQTTDNQEAKKEQNATKSDTKNDETQKPA